MQTVTQSSKRILLIDDDPVQLRLREAVLRDAGLQVDIATSADSALALLRSQPADGIGLVVTDHIMPGTNGSKFVRLVRQVRPEVPIIVISGLPDAEEEYSGLTDVTFRQKPVPPPQLIELVQQKLGSKS